MKIQQNADFFGHGNDELPKIIVKTGINQK
jgi:hypothetical protein